MLVQVSFTNTESLPANFDEQLNRITSQIQYENWEEYIVAWRKDRLELYTDFVRIPFPNKGGRVLTDSIFSPYRARNGLSATNDWRLSFRSHKPQRSYRCILPQISHFALPVPHSEYVRDLGQQVAGYCTALPRAQIYLFSTSNPERGQLIGCGSCGESPTPCPRQVSLNRKPRRHLGGELPPAIEIGCPILDTRLRVEIPDYEHGYTQEAFTVFTPSNIVNLCRKALQKVEDYQELIASGAANGASLGLAWRMNMQLDWIWHTDDVTGKYRDWAILYGLTLRQVCPPPCTIFANLKLDILVGEESSTP